MRNAFHTDNQPGLYKRNGSRRRSVHTFLSSRFLMTFFRGCRKSFAFIAGLIILSSTIFNSSRRSFSNCSYSSFRRTVRVMVASGVAADSWPVFSEEEPTIGQYIPSNSTTNFNWFAKIDDHASRHALLDSMIYARISGVS